MKKILLTATATALATLLGTPASAGTILGKVTVADGASVQGPGTLDKHELIRFERGVVISEKGGLANAVVYLHHTFAESFSTEDRKVVVDQKEETYVPHVTPIVKGTTVDFLNSDRILHNVHVYLNGESLFNRAMPLMNQRTSKRFDETGVVRLSCDVHKHMQAYVLVLDNPYFATTNEAGLFVIKDVPPGTYELRMWHERLASEITKTVTVSADGKAPAVFEVPGASLSR